MNQIINQTQIQIKNLSNTIKETTKLNQNSCFQFKVDYVDLFLGDFQ